MLKLKDKEIRQIVLNNEGFKITEKKYEYKFHKGYVLKIEVISADEEFVHTYTEWLSRWKTRRFIKKHLKNIRFVA